MPPAARILRFRALALPPSSSAPPSAPQAASASTSSARPSSTTPSQAPPQTTQKSPPPLPQNQSRFPWPCPPYELGCKRTESRKLANRETGESQNPRLGANPTFQKLCD